MVFLVLKMMDYLNIRFYGVLGSENDGLSQYKRRNDSSALWIVKIMQKPIPANEVDKSHDHHPEEHERREHGSDERDNHVMTVLVKHVADLCPCRVRVPEFCNVPDSNGCSYGGQEEPHDHHV